MTTKDAKSGILISGRALLTTAKEVIQDCKKIPLLMALDDESKIIKKVGLAHEFPSGFTIIDLKYFILFQLQNWALFYGTTVEEITNKIATKASAENAEVENVDISGADMTEQVGWSQTQGSQEDGDELLEPTDDILDEDEDRDMTEPFQLTHYWTTDLLIAGN